MQTEEALTIDEFLVALDKLLAQFKRQMALYPDLTWLTWEEWLEQLLAFWDRQA